MSTPSSFARRTEREEGGNQNEPFAASALNIFKSAVSSAENSPFGLCGFAGIGGANCPPPAVPNVGAEPMEGVEGPAAVWTASVVGRRVSDGSDAQEKAEGKKSVPGLPSAPVTTFDCLLDAGAGGTTFPFSSSCAQRSPRCTRQSSSKER